MPEYILKDKQLIVLEFPDKFPMGIVTYNTENRHTKLTLCSYFHQCLRNVDGHFAHNMEYFYTQYSTDIKQIQIDSNLTLQLTNRKYIFNGKKVTAGTLTSPADL